MKEKWISAVIVILFIIGVSLGIINLISKKVNATSWSIETVDSKGDVGLETSIALDSNDYAHISYTNGDYSDLKYARNNDVSDADQDKENGLFAQYWWIFNIIATVIIVLIVYRVLTRKPPE